MENYPGGRKDIDSNKIAQEQVMRVVRRSLQGDHKGAPLLWTSLASRFVA
jgi:hypothetical protein